MFVNLISLLMMQILKDTKLHIVRLALEDDLEYQMKSCIECMFGFQPI